MHWLAACRGKVAPTQATHASTTKHHGNLPHGSLHLPKRYLAGRMLAPTSLEDVAMIPIFLVDRN
jgi:hypothetical protein